MKKKNLYLVLTAAALSLLISSAAFGEEPGWIKKEDGWHYYLEDQNPAFGWIEIDGKFYYLQGDGRMMTDGITPDGYYVDQEGVWYERAETILGTSFKAPKKQCHPGEEWAGKEALAGMKTKIQQRFSGKRSFRLGDNAIEFVKIEAGDKETAKTTSKSSTGAGSTGSISWKTAGSDSTESKETILLGLYREPGNGRYRMDIRVALDGERADSSDTASCNYEVFKSMVYQISSAPELLADALYSAWEEENLWGIGREQWLRIGDCEVRYGSGDGYGRFYIRPATGGN